MCSSRVAHLRLAALHPEVLATPVPLWPRGGTRMMGFGPDIPTAAATRTPLMRAQRGSTRAARAWVKQWQASHGPPQYRAPAASCTGHHCTRQQDIPLVLLQLSSTPARALLTHEKWMRTWWTLNPEHSLQVETKAGMAGQRGAAGGLAGRSSGQP